jgi:hypothetical protein
MSFITERTRSIASPIQIGYCTNVHAGRDLTGVLKNIQEFCSPIQRLVDPKKELGVGLWFSELSAKEALEPGQLDSLRSLLEHNRLVPFTLNGFPQGDFHSQIVKHRVYLPTWWDVSRLNYTRNLVRILDAILPEGQIGSISTLPIAWSDPPPTSEQLEVAADHLMLLANELHQLFQKTGRTIVIAIEPEPGCYLTNSQSFRRFYNRYLSAPRLSESQASIAREHLTLCHDVCHAAVMFEDQAWEFAELAKDGIGIGKVQVSSAIEMDWRSLSLNRRAEAIRQLKGFAEDRYLHQTTFAQSDATGVLRYASMQEDLTIALANVLHESFDFIWRVHFHVPIFLENFGLLRTTQSEIVKCVELLTASSAKKQQGDRKRFTGHYEIETYAWGVLPEELKIASLSTGIARETMWFAAIANKALIEQLTKCYSTNKPSKS